MTTHATGGEPVHESTVEARDVAAVLGSYFTPDQLAELRAGATALRLARGTSPAAGVWDDLAGTLDTALADVDLDQAAASYGPPQDLPIAVPPLALIRTDPGTEWPRQTTLGRTVLVFDRGIPSSRQAARLHANRARAGEPLTVQLADGSTSDLIPPRTGFILGGAAELAQRLWVTPVDWL